VIQAEKEGGTLKVEQIRAIRQSLVLKPYQGSYRVRCFCASKKPTPTPKTPCSKRWREAPSYVVLILTADTPEQLLPTILSRCEVLRLRRCRWSG